jgi:hypothetical protein
METYRVVAVDTGATRGIPAFVAAITVPNIMTADRIAAKIKPAVFICIPLVRNTHGVTAGYAK